MPKIKALGIEEYSSGKYDSAVVFGGKVPQIDCKVIAAEVFENTGADIIIKAVSSLETESSFTTDSGVITTKAVY